MSKNKTRDFLRAVRENDECEIRRTLKEVLKEKVLKRLKEVEET